jgi:hypothetical protein
MNKGAISATVAENPELMRDTLLAEAPDPGMKRQRGRPAKYSRFLVEDEVLGACAGIMGWHTACRRNDLPALTAKQPFSAEDGTPVRQIIEVSSLGPGDADGAADSGVTHG